MKTFYIGQKKIPLFTFDNPEQIGIYLSKKILSALTLKSKTNNCFLLGCPGGRSLGCFYDVLGQTAYEMKADLSDLIIVMMDEYLQSQDKSFSYCPPNAHYSCVNFAFKNILQPINSHLDENKRIKETNLWFPAPKSPQLYDEAIKNAGGVDIFLAASGASDGHVAFNPCGTDLYSYSRIVELAEKTRKDNMKTFPAFKNIEEVPKYGVTVGLGTISEYSKEVVLVMHGKDKRESVKKITELGNFSLEWPASFIFECKNASVVIDKEAASTSLDHDLQSPLV